MKKSIAFVFLIIVFATHSSLLFATQNFLHYSFERKDSNSLIITFSFSGNNSGRSVINFPNQWAGQTELYNSIVELNPVGKNIHLEYLAGEKADVIVTYKAGATVTLKYILKKDWNGSLRYPLYFRPVIEKDFFYFEGFSGLIYPDINDSEKIGVQLSFESNNGNEFIGNSFFVNKTEGKFITTLADLRNSIFCAGNYRFKEIDVRKTKLLIAVTGNFLFNDDSLFSNISRIITEERKFWNDFSAPYFFTVLLPLSDQGSSGGTAHYNSFALFQSVGLRLDQGVTYLISHEYFHNWLGQGLKMPEPEELSKWFQEGFTDYYSYKILYSIDLINEKNYTDKINEIFREYYLSDYFKTSNEELIGNYWKNPSLKLLSYQRGLILAFLLDNYLVKNDHKSLDDFIKELYEESKPKLRFEKGGFDKILLKYADERLLSLVDSVNKGNNTSLSSMLIKNSNYSIKELIVSKKFDLGFDLGSSVRTKKITGLKANSNAAIAGLKEGMEITTNVSIWNNNTEKPAKIEAIVNGQKKWIEFYPVEKIEVKIPQIIL